MRYPEHSQSGYPTRIKATSTAQLIWAVPVSIESFISGLAYHRFWYGRMRAFRESIIVPKEGSTEMVSRLPEEILSIIENMMRTEGREVGGIEVESWLHSLHSSSSISERQILREKRRQFEEQLDKTSHGPVAFGEAQCYMDETFSLSITPGLSTSFHPSDFVRYGRWTHILICLPCHSIETMNHLVSKPKYTRSYAYETKDRASKLEHCINRQGGWRTTSTQRVSVVDPEYATMTEEKMLRVNRAIREMELDVISVEGQPPLQDMYRISTRPKFLPDQESFEAQLSDEMRFRSINDLRLDTPLQAMDFPDAASYSSSGRSFLDRNGNPTDLLNNEELDENDDSVGAKDGVRFKRRVDTKFRAWPSFDKEGWGTLWEPQLLLKHQCELRNWDWEGFITNDEIWADDETDIEEGAADY